MKLQCPIAVGAVAVAALLAGCSDPKVLTSSAQPPTDGGATDASSASDAGSEQDGSDVATVDGAITLPPGAAVGESCADDDACRAGLKCESGVCAPSRTAEEGAACLLSAECESGLQCAENRCAPTGTRGPGDACSNDLDCASSLRCGIVGFAAQCVTEGTADIGQDCSLSGDCFAGLLCGPQAVCAPVPRGQPAFGLPASPELDCADETEAPIVAHFEIPGAPGTDPDADFFRLPFPNDVRIVSGTIELNGFPTPGVSPLLGVDPVKPYLDAIRANETAWGTSPTVVFRFSGQVDAGSLRQSGGDPPTVNPVRWIDVTDPEAPRNGGLSWQLDPNPTAYVCPNWLAVRRPLGLPLEAGRTYAVWVTTDAFDASGEPVARDPQFSAMLGETPPNDAVLSAAWTRYAPLRSYLAAEGIDPDTVLVATMITTADPRAEMAALARNALGIGDPAPAAWVRCEPGVQSPCTDGTAERECGGDDDDYDEYHAAVDFPIFQRGEPPYLKQGGSIQKVGVARTEAVCLSLTVPKAPPPSAAGYPVVVFGHGTGGSFRSHVRPEVAGALSSAQTPDGPLPMAVLGYDAVQHGPRRGDSDESPNNLFFNFLNPEAARGNVLQGAADVIWAGRLAVRLRVPASVTGGDEVKGDPGAIVYFGHSQGALHGSLGLPYSGSYTTAVLSGNGASLLHALRRKRQPVDIAAAVPLILGDFRVENGAVELPGGDSHPVLSLVQHWIDPADPLNFASALTVEPVPPRTSKHVLQTYGHGDTYSPDVTLRAYAIAAQLAVAAADETVDEPVSIGGRSPQSVPLADTDGDEATQITYGVRQYAPESGHDGHFVVFDVPAANEDAVRFLAMGAAGQVPQIGP